MKFFKTFFAALLALFAFCLIIVLFFSVIGMMSSDEVIVEEKSVLHLTFDNPIQDHYIDNPLNIDLNTFQPIQGEGLDRILKQIAKAKVDERIKGIFIDTDMPQAGLATLQEIREALVDFKTSGKWILSYSDIMSQGAYYLASTADEIYMQPEGMCELKGLRADITFLKSLLDKVGVDVQVIRPTNNRFKSAVEPFIYDSMSVANEEQLNRILGSIWSHISAEIAESRGMDASSFEQAVNNLSSANTESATAAGLIDGAMYRDEIIAELRSRLELEEDDELELISLGSYAGAKVSDFDHPSDNLLADDKVAVIYASGEIGMGEESEEAIGSDGISSLIREAREDEDIKAIVLRVNSPGGSALASDVIWREMTLAKEEKPVVVSMGDLAASGGYYISCNADKIFANELTITGSIGVFGMIPNTRELNEDILGMHHDGVKTHNFADMMDLHRPMREEESALWQRQVDNIYGDFTGKVAAGRGMPQATVDSIGQGRVWSGVDASGIKLIDAYGGLQDAIDEACEMAGLEDYRLKSYPEAIDPMERIIKDLTGQSNIDPLEAMSQEDVELYTMLKRYRQIMKLEGIQARMPFELDIH